MKHLAHSSVLAASALAALAVPLAAFAAQADLSWLQNMVQAVGAIINRAIPIVFALILLAFFWGLAKFIFGGTKENADQGKSLMIWSVIALFVAASVWGIVNLMQGLFGINDIESTSAPTVPGLPSS